MEYFIDQSFNVPWGDYDVVKEDDTKAFHVESKVSLGHELTVFDSYGKEVGKLAEKLEIVPTYLAWENSIQCGTIYRKLAFPKPRMIVDYKDWNISKDFRDLKFEIKHKDGHLIAKIDRKKWRMTDHYVMEVPDE